MKKALLILLALSTLAGTCPLAHGQTTTRIGIKGGFHVSSLLGNDVPIVVGQNTRSKTGFFAAAVVRINLSRTVSLQPELSYIIRGIRHDGVIVDSLGNTASGTVSTDLAYLTLTLPIRKNLLSGRSVTPAVFFGPELAILQSAKAVFENSRIGTVEFPIDEAVHDVDIALTAGFGLDIHTGTGRIITDIRYTIGLTSIDASEVDGNVHNSTLSLSVGYLFPLHRWW